MSGLRVGAEVALDEVPKPLRTGRIGLVVHPASLLRTLQPTHHAFAERFGTRLTTLFSPQHGFFGEKQDNMIESPHEVDAATGRRVYSLYGAVRRPTSEMLSEVDVLAVDLQDVGCRVYTYIWTLTECMKACAALGIPVVVLDRPNPVGGVAVEGPRLAGGFETFVGMADVPLRHGLTLGELACAVRTSLAIDVALHVIAVKEWDRRGSWPSWGRAWVPPSPNLPRYEGAQVYPGQVMFEGTNLSEGRGTTTPFEQCGAPWLDPERWLASVLHDGPVTGAVLRPVRFEPGFGKAAGQRCGGLWIHVVDESAYAPVRTSLRLLAAAFRMAPEECAWTRPPYEYEQRLAPIDCITGSSAVRHWVEGGGVIDQLDEVLALDGWVGSEWHESF